MRLVTAEVDTTRYPRDAPNDAYPSWLARELAAQGIALLPPHNPADRRAAPRLAGVWGWEFDPLSGVLSVRQRLDG